MVTKVSLVGSIQRDNLLEQVDFLRLEASQRLESNRAEKGQFFTPQSIARFMATMFTQRPQILNILDAGAGVGSLTAALVAEACSWETKPARIRATACEVEPVLLEYLRSTLDYCCQVCQQESVEFDCEIVPDDFIEASVDTLRGGSLFASLRKSFNAAIMNPPYRKINSQSSSRRLLRKVGIETSNLYAAFIWLAIRLLEPEGEIVAITPRSFCNGPYFLPFRKALLASMSIRRIHVFEYRDKAFQEDGVLQENVILHALKSQRRGRIVISASADPDDEWAAIREVTYSQVVRSDDPELFIHIAPYALNQQIGQRVEHLSTSLNDLGICVSTGRVVDFRTKEFLRERPGRDTAPLIYPSNFSEGYIVWPGEQSKKPSAIKIEPGTESLLIPRGWYVLVRRFSAKEEKRRLVAAVYDPTRIEASHIGIENHLNYYHRNGQGLPPALAKGLAAFLNSTIADEYFRQFSGHTQVNATDLRNFRYPTKAQLLAIGESIGEIFPPQKELDELVLEKLGMMTTTSDLQAKRKLEEAIEILRALQVPKAQINQRSALTLLALLDVKPDTQWADASAPLCGATEMMNYFRDHFGVTYAPSTRETARRQTIRQFLRMGLVISNPDDPARPVNSPRTRYQIEPGLLNLIRSFGTDEWGTNLKSYLVLQRRFA